MQIDKDVLENNEPTIIFEDDNVMVINKPAGLLVHGDGRSEQKTVVEWFLDCVPQARGIGELAYGQSGIPLERSGIVHRLDRETSGVMILAKTAVAHSHLKQQFHDRLAKKEYRAIVYGAMKDRFGTITRSIGRSRKDARLRSAEHGAVGVLRDAMTAWERIGNGEVDGEVFSYLLLKPKTGRTHQLRVHLRAIDRPIVGDTLYASHKITNSHNLQLRRLALHSHVLTINIPNGEEQRFVAPIPPELEQAVERIAELPVVW